MPLPSWMKPEELTPENREYGIKHRETLAGMADTSYRIVEMTGILGLVTYIEQKAYWEPYLSILLGAFMWAYIQSKLGIGLLSAVDRYSWSEKVKRRAFRSLIVISFAIATGIYITLQVYVIPAFVAKESGSSATASVLEPIIPRPLVNPDRKPDAAKRRADASQNRREDTSIKSRSRDE